MTNKPVRTSELDSSFKHEIKTREPTHNLNYCYTCGACSAGCPIHEVFPEYDPRKIIRMALLGMKERLLSSKSIWLCSTCYTCNERCPQKVNLTDIVYALKNLAVKEGRIQPLYKDQIRSIATYGTLYKIDNKRRQRYNLPPVSTNSDEVIKIFEIAGLKNYME